jgi:hypothetical protein
MGVQGRRGHRASGGSSIVSLGPAMIYHFTHCGQPIPSWTTDFPGVGRSQGEILILVTKILNFPCRQPTSNWPLGWSGVDCPQSIELGAR